MPRVMQLPRWVWVLMVALLVVGSFFISFLVGQRMITQMKAPIDMAGRLEPTLAKPQKVEVYVPEASPTLTPAPASTTPSRFTGRRARRMGGYAVQVGAFKSKKNAWAERARLRKLGYKAVVYKMKSLYRVQVGYSRTLQQAKALASQLNRKGITAIAVRL